MFQSLIQKIITLKRLIIKSSSCACLILLRSLHLVVKSSSIIQLLKSHCNLNQSLPRLIRLQLLLYEVLLLLCHMLIMWTIIITLVYKITQDFKAIKVGILNLLVRIIEKEVITHIVSHRLKLQHLSLRKKFKHSGIKYLDLGIVM